MESLKVDVYENLDRLPLEQLVQAPPRIMWDRDGTCGVVDVSCDEDELSETADSGQVE